jgi:mono/diheme cytochrome c family protein
LNWAIYNMLKMRGFIPASVLFSAFIPLALGQTPVTAASTAALATTPADSASVRATLNKYCIMCHNAKLKSGGVQLDVADTKNVGLDAATWEKVLRKLTAGEMPPPKMPRPNPATYATTTAWLRSELDSNAAAHPNPGHPTIHRLNRAEYSNAIRDLLALDIQPGSRLPVDDGGYGFDNIGDVLSLSPMLIERYMSTARLVSRLAVGDVSFKTETNLYALPRGNGGHHGRVSDAMPFDSSGGMAINYEFPVDAEYVIKIKTPPSKPTPTSGPAPEPQIFELRLPVKAGARTLGVTYMAENALPESVVTMPVRRGAPAPVRPAENAKLDLRLDGERLKLFDVAYLGQNPQLSSVTIAGPYETTGPGDTPSRKKIFTCSPRTEKAELPCARKILSNLARMAYRRPVTDADISPLIAFYQIGRQEAHEAEPVRLVKTGMHRQETPDPCFDRGIERALRAILVSPDFLFRIERDPENAVPGTVHRISDLDLASRLSFFLWSSIPDDQLLTLATECKLSKPAVLQAQVTRMLDDPRSKAFVSNFAGQWLYLRNLAQVRPDPDLFPTFDATLSEAFRQETDLFVDAIMRENRPVTDLLSANFTYLNERLANHYGVPDVYGSQFRRVELKDPSRGGLLGQGSILTVTSYPNRTSVVQRGKWVLENLLGSPPPPPPPNIPALEATSKDGKQLTARQQMEQHRVNPVCASCHARMDPIGFSLENYDGIGAWRTKDAGTTIDTSGKLTDGTEFQGPAGLKHLLLTKLREEFIETFSEKLMTYALGRGLEYYDKPAIRGIAAQAEKSNDSIPAFIQAIVSSQQFQMRKTL